MKDGGGDELQGGRIAGKMRSVGKRCESGVRVGIACGSLAGVDCLVRIADAHGCSLFELSTAKSIGSSPVAYELKHQMLNRLDGFCTVHIGR